LRRWLDEGREDLAFLAELRQAARQWDTRGRPEGLVWSGEAVADARHFRARFRGELAPRESQFLDAVMALSSRAARRRRTAVVGVIVALALLVAGGSVALVQIERAKNEADGQAVRATREADRARTAEQQIKDQLAQIENEQRAKEKARAEVAQGKQKLDVVNGELAGALDKARAESKKAQDESEKALAEAAHSKELAESLKRSKAELERLLAEERARAQKLEQERKKIGTQLK
jgi:hypothetical protein